MRSVPLHKSLDSRFYHSPLRVWFNLPCLTVWILGYPFILLYLPPHSHELFEVSTIHAATDPRPSLSFYTPQARSIPSRRICMNCLNVLTAHAAMDPRSSFSFYTHQPYRNSVASRRIRPISCFYTIKP